MLTEVLTRNDPANCAEVVTERFLEQGYDEPGSEAVEACRFEAAVYDYVFADAIDFSDVSTDGAEGSVTFTITGGAGDGTTATIGLVHDADQWKLDRYTEIEIDRTRADRALYETSLDEGMSPSEARCLVEENRRLWSTAELERQSLEADFTDLPDPTVLCLSRDTLVRLLTKAFNSTVASEEDSDLPEPLLDCILNRFTERLTFTQMQTLFSAGDAAASYMDRIATSAGKACAREYEAGLLGERPKT